MSKYENFYYKNYLFYFSDSKNEIQNKIMF